MLLPTLVSVWYAEAVTRVYAPWLVSGRVGDRQRRQVAELIGRARREACLPPLDERCARPPAWPPQRSRPRPGPGQDHGHAGRAGYMVAQ